MKKKSMMIRGLAMVLLFCSQAFGADFYVDAVNGNDGNSGSSSSDAWQTIRFATSSAPGQTIHVAPGVYDSSNGNFFPATLSPGTKVVGTDGPDQTILDAGGTGATMFRVVGYGNARIDGLWLRNGGRGVSVPSNLDTPYSFSLNNVRISSMTEYGVYGEVYSFIATITLNIGISQSIIEDCGMAISVSASSVSGSDANFSLNCTNTLIVDNDAGVLAVAEDFGLASGQVSLAGCRLDNNATYAVAVGAASLSSVGNTFAHNGIGVSSDWFFGASLDKCDLIGNGVGIRTNGGPVNAKNSIVRDNGANVIGSGFSPSFCNLSGGPQIGTNGNISGDPLFWAPGINDYHLKAGSPCIDAGSTPGTDIGTFPYDGNYVPDPIQYCQGGLNSIGQRSQIAAAGSAQISANTFTLTSFNNPPSVMGIFFYGIERVSIPFGDGLRCVGAGGLGLFRLGPAALTDVVGNISQGVDFTTAPAGSGPGKIFPGSRWNFQFWYRDPAGPGMTGFNLSNAVTAWFLP